MPFGQNILKGALYTDFLQLAKPTLNLKISLIQSLLEKTLIMI